MAKRKRKPRARVTTTLSSRHKKSSRKRRKSSGLHDGGLTKNVYLDAAIGGGAVLLTLWGLNKLPIDDIKNKTGKGLDDPLIKKAIAVGVGAGAGYLLKSKGMVTGAIGAGIFILTNEKLQLADDNDSASISWVDQNLLSNGNNGNMLLTDAGAFQLSDKGEVLFQLSEDASAYGYDRMEYNR